ncbi:hypothetical protein SUGI_0120410 [Cryptomeria japonica]|uniref:MYB-like transcription factor EOBII n=1 Tax=Cryptomeria japonica TaxID=3369 RepID=UPI002408D81F|nr:MYB-like transcription factor EOBII [Cryptomeria japonica]GLJ10020.1 hypothetical protein SUGI_0120410 [Cryptomeria japonica]
MYNQEEEPIRKGPWTMEEDLQLLNHIACHGEGRWDFAAKTAGLRRNGKSCRMRWVNYLRPDLKRGNITPQEERLIIELQSRWGNRWSLIARRLPGRTDNEIKNYWRTRLKRKFHTPNTENQSSKRCIYSSSMPNPFVQQNSGVEFDGGLQAQINLQPSVTLNNIVIDFDEQLANQEIIDSVRVTNGINNLEECSCFGVVEGMPMPYEESYEGMLSELYGHVTHGGAVSQFNGF